MMLLKYLVALVVAGTLFGCAALATAPMATLTPQPTATSLPTSTPLPTPSPTPSAYKDPFAYCVAVGDIDAPDSRYVGDKTPDVIVDGLRKTLNTPASAPTEIFKRATFWRCMKSQVYACFVGANLPCDAKANTEMKPTQAETDYCKKNPRADIPAAVTGHETIYSWKCVSGKPTIAKQVFHVDARGYIYEIWYAINPS
jgi:hypothetical protein